MACPNLGPPSGRVTVQKVFAPISRRPADLPVPEGCGFGPCLKDPRRAGHGSGLLSPGSEGRGEEAVTPAPSNVWLVGRTCWK